jgi:hypothetical protein
VSPFLLDLGVDVDRSRHRYQLQPGDFLSIPPASECFFTTLGEPI